jgi:hypothetical protein
VLKLYNRVIFRNFGINWCIFCNISSFRTLAIVLLCVTNNVIRMCIKIQTCVFLHSLCRIQLKCDGTRWRREGKWRGNWRMEWVASTLHTTSEHGASSITTANVHSSQQVVDWTDAPADLNGLVRFAERPNLVSARVPSHFKRSLPNNRP